MKEPFNNIVFSIIGFITTFLILLLIGNVSLKAMSIRINKLKSEKFDPNKIKISSSKIFTKRVFDIIISFYTIFFVLIWLIPLIAILIKIESKGPIFLIYQGTGLNGKKYKFLKFRTSKNNDDPFLVNAAFQKWDNLNLTKVGLFLIRTSLDVFPSFISVFLGDISVVGLSSATLLRNTINPFNEEQKKLLAEIKPGITSLYNVSKDNITFDLTDVLKFDLYYINNFSIRLDIKILYATAVKIFGITTVFDSDNKRSIPFIKSIKKTDSIESNTSSE